MTVTELLDTIQRRCGQMQDSIGWTTQRAVIKDFVASAAAMIDNDFRDRLRYVPNKLLVVATEGSYENPEDITSYTVPADCDPNYIDDLSVLWSGIWFPINRGITQSMRDDAYTTTNTFLAWDVIECGDIELWPHPEDTQQVRISYTRKPNSYLEETGCVDMDSQLLIMLTLDSVLPFYGRDAKDIDANNRHLNRYIGNIRAKQLNGKRFRKQTSSRPGSPDHADLIYRFPRQV
jgi:hypothetical protein